MPSRYNREKVKEALNRISEDDAKELLDINGRRRWVQEHCP